MDPVTLIVGALAAGAATGLTDATAQAIKDCYGALKSLIARKYPDVSTSGVERKPQSERQRGALDEELREEGAAQDEELVAAARVLLDAIKDAESQTAETVGIDLSKIWADSIDIEDINAKGGSTAVRASEVSARSVKIKGVETDGSGSTHP